MNAIILNQNPLIYIIDDFLDDSTCNHFIELSKNKLKRALVVGEGNGIIINGRTNTNCWIEHNTDNVTYGVVNKISNLVKYPIINAESFQIIHYDINQKYNNHNDGWKQNDEKNKKYLSRGGQRMITALVYLNDVEEGGDTIFTKLKISVKPKKGRLLVFENFIKDTNELNLLSEHTGSAVIKGEKYAFNLWFREDKYI